MTLSLALVFLFEEGTFKSRDQCVDNGFNCQKVRKNIAMRQIKFPLKLRNSVERQIKFPLNLKKIVYRQIKFPLNFKKFINRQIKFPPNMPILPTSKLNSRQNFFP